MQTTVQLTDIRKSFPTGFCLRVPQLTFQQGKIYALMGPSGSGKTTLLKILALLLRPDAGEIRINDMPVGNDPGQREALRRRITMVMQDAYLFKTSVEKNVTYGLRLRFGPWWRSIWKHQEIQQKARETLTVVGLKNFAQRRAGELSRGEAQRVALARALVLNPAILLLDEPTANVDSANAALIEAFIRDRVSGQGATLIMTTHNPTQAYRLGDQVISIIGGEVVQTGSENLFAGQLRLTPDGACADLAPGVTIQVAEMRSGPVHLLIDPRDIVISRSTFQSSARNSFRGIITHTAMEHNQIKLHIDVGLPLTALITRQSFNEMGLNLGETVYVTFKSSAVQVF